MPTNDVHFSLRQLFAELTDGVARDAAAFILNPGDAGLLRSLDNVSVAEASDASNGGATLAAHVEHLRYGLSLMNRWASEDGNPFADATWGEAWKIIDVNDAEWREIRRGLRSEAERWRDALAVPRAVSPIELSGMIGSVAHLAYHLGAIRQISKKSRGPKEGAGR